MSAPQLEESFPNLRAAGYRITSEPAPVPNCTGWALGDVEHVWDPFLAGFLPIYYWPPGVPRNDSLEALAQVFQLHQYEDCDSAELEPRWEKIAIYADATGEATHSARQLPSGAWTSKLGQEEDIDHETLGALVSSIYGSVSKVMRRPRKS
jgi:hypothetical protein